VLGAWLHIWTPPRGVHVPPPPRGRTLAVFGIATALVVAGALALIIPPLDRGKREGAEARAKEEAQAVAAETARLRNDQRVHHARFAPGASAVATLERLIHADAQARERAGTIGGPIVTTTCNAATRNVVIYPASRVYKCFVKTATGQRGQGEDILGTGYPFVATVYQRTHRVAWCKQNPRPDEKTQGHKLADVKLSPECAGRLSEVL
jgi:hypothetical protein